MADEPQVVRGIDWKSTFPFTRLFRAFRIAIHPSKLVLALLALVLIYFGGRFLDGIWPSGSLAVPGEMGIYLTTRDDPNPSLAFQSQRDEIQKDALDRFQARLKQIGHADGNLDDIKWDILQRRDREVDATRQDYDKYLKDNQQAIDKDPKVRKDQQDLRDRRIFAAYAQARAEYDGFAAVKGVGLFATFMESEIAQAYGVIHGVRDGQWLSKNGALESLFGLLVGAPAWAMQQHWVYFTLFFLWCLIIWAIFGGAIARIAAVQVARDEKISFRQALSFSTAKFLSFVSAPIIPLLIVVVVGLVVALGGLLFNVPVVGTIIGGALFFLALAAGFIMTLVLVGLIGGFNLMYPTVAVEGSDSFDAISRSFSYLYARPWRLIFYSLVAAIYGVLCYLFVRYFIWLMLALTHCFAGLFIFRHAGNTLPVWNAMWPDPMTRERLSYVIDHLALGGGDDAGAFLVAIWVYLTIATLGAFAVSFYLSANTIIYVLMRHEVDATELDDVYLEQSEEDLEGTAAGTTTTTTVSDAAPAPVVPSPAPPAQPESPAAPTSNEPPPEDSPKGDSPGA